MPCRTNLELLEKDATPTGQAWHGEASHHPSKAPLGRATAQVWLLSPSSPEGQESSVGKHCRTKGQSGPNHVPQVRRQAVDSLGKNKENDDVG